MTIQHVCRATLLAACLLSTACGQRSEPPAQAAPVAQAGVVTISEPRVRVPPGGRDVTAAYLTLTNTGPVPVMLLGASSPDASRIELHTHLTDGSGMKAMRQLKSVELPAQADVPFVPGGLHLMVFGVTRDAVAKGAIQVTLSFDGPASATFSMPFVANPSTPGSTPAKDGDHVHHQGMH